MNSAEMLVEFFGRVRGLVHRVVQDLTEDQLAARPEPRANSIAWLDQRANSIAWLVWHLTRIQDNHVADAADTEELWTSAGWADRFDLPFDTAATGYGQNPDDAARVRASADLLAGYHDAVSERTVGFVQSLTDHDLVRVVDESWDPPVTLGVRLVSVVSDDLQHVGQAAYARGLVT